MKAIIPAAGLGTRFLPATKAVAKEMLPVLSKPTIQYVVEEALGAAADEVVIVSNAQKPSIEEHFSVNRALVDTLEAAGKAVFAEEVRRAGELSVSFVEQSEALGLGHAVLMAADKVLGAGAGGAESGSATTVATGSNPAATASDSNATATADSNTAVAEPFYVLLGDTIVPDNTILPRMQAISEQHGGVSVIAVFKVPHEQVNRFGIISGNEIAANVWQITGLVEKPPVDKAPTDLAVFGRYLLSPRIMELLKTTAPGAGGEIQLTDAMIALLEYEKMYALVIDADEGFDVGTIETWLTTNIALAMRDEKLRAAIIASAHGGAHK